MHRMLNTKKTKTIHCHRRTDTSTTVNIHEPLEMMGKNGCLERFCVYYICTCLSEPVMNAHSTANVIRTLYVATIELLHKIIEIGTICDQNFSRACVGHHLVLVKSSNRTLQERYKFLDLKFDLSLYTIYFHHKVWNR